MMLKLIPTFILLLVLFSCTPSSESKYKLDEVFSSWIGTSMLEIKGININEVVLVRVSQFKVERFNNSLKKEGIVIKKKVTINKLLEAFKNKSRDLNAITKEKKNAKNAYYNIFFFSEVKRKGYAVIALFESETISSQHVIGYKYPNYSETGCWGFNNELYAVINEIVNNAKKGQTATHEM